MLPKGNHPIDVEFDKFDAICYKFYWKSMPFSFDVNFKKGIDEGTQRGIFAHL